MVAFNLRVKSNFMSGYTLTVILLVILITVTTIPLGTIIELSEDKTLLKENMKKTTPVLTSIITTQKISLNKEKVQQLDDLILKPDDITPTNILRGSGFYSVGRLMDNESGLPWSNQPILVYWSYFTWNDFETNKNWLDTNYLVGQDLTDSEGYFNVPCIDNTFSKKIGNVTVFTIFPGDPLQGDVTENRQDDSAFVNCFAKTRITLIPSETLLGQNDTFYAESLLLFDNGTALNQANGYNASFYWLGSQYNESFIFNFANRTLQVGNTTIIGDYILQVSFYIPTLSLPYIVGTINSPSLLGTPDANWANASVQINIRSGASITFSITEPIAPGPGLYPKVVLDQTQINVTGVILDENDLPFGFAIDMNVFVFHVNQTSPIRVSTTTNNLGEFSVLFTLTGTDLHAGDNLVWMTETDAGITAYSQYRYITIYGNSSIESVQVNGSNPSTYMGMPGEFIRVTGNIRDSYTSIAIENMTIQSRWGSTGAIHTENSSGTGAFNFDILIPSTLGPTVRNGTIYLWTQATTYHTASNDNFTILIFTQVIISVKLNETIVAEDSTVYSLQGNTIYYNSSFTISGRIVDQFGRGVNGRSINLTYPTNVYILSLNSDGNFSQTITGQEGVTNGTYLLTITFNEDYDFSFSIRYSNYQTSTTPTPTPSPTNTGVNLLTGRTLIYIGIGLVSVVIIISGVYAFGRFRKSKKKLQPAPGQRIMDLPTILELIEESEKAKDYKRATILTYQAFELICVHDFRIPSPWTHSPRELARLVANTNRVPVRDVTMLVMRYEKARFSEHLVNAAEFKQARQALHNIQLALEQESLAKR